MSSSMLALASLVAAAAVVTPALAGPAADRGADPSFASFAGLAAQDADRGVDAAAIRDRGVDGSAVRVGCATHPGPLDGDLVRTHLHELLAAERIPAIGVVDVAVRATELDGDVRTEEALVDVIAPAMCLAGACPTIVVQRGRDGQLATVGRGVGLYTIATRSSGWSDLSESGLLPVPRRTLRFVRGRYQ